MVSTETPSSRPPRPEWTEEALAREASILTGHVDALSSLLREHVAKHLEAECAATVIPEEWIDNAYQALLTELPDANACHTADLEQARRQAIASLRESLERSEPAVRPAAEEVLAHTRELAQCVVSNWLSLIKLSHRRAHRAGRVLVLDDAWLPEGASTAQLSRGLSVFAADPQFTLEAWQGYLTQQVQESAPFPIAARLQLTRAGDERRVISSAAAQEAKADRVMEGVVEEILLSSGGPTQSPVGMPDPLELEAEWFAARVAAATVQEDRLSPNLRTAAWASREPNLVYDFAQCILGECSKVLAPQRWTSPPLDDVALKEAWHQLSQRFSHTTDKSWEKVCRVAKIATVYASAAHNGFLELQVDEERSKLEHFSQITGKAVAPDDTIVLMASEVARCAMNLPRSSFLESRLHDRFTQEI